MMQFNCHVRGIAPLLFNRFPDDDNPDGVSKARKAVNSKEVQVETSLYRNADGKIYQPADHFVGAMTKAGANFKFKGRQTFKDIVKGGVFVEPMQIVHEKQTYETDWRSVVIPSTKGRVMKGRGRMDSWELKFTITCIDDRANANDIKQNIIFTNYGETEGRDENNNLTGTFHSYDVAFTGAYGSPVNNKLGLGVAAKFIYSHLSDQGAGAEKGTGVGTSMAVDLGVMYRQAFTKGLTLAATLTNMGPAISYIDRAQADPLPMTIRVGGSYKLLDSEFNRLTVNLDLLKELVDRYDDGRAMPFYIAMFTLLDK